jgi:hypothetical protein
MRGTYQGGARSRTVAFSIGPAETESSSGVSEAPW